MPDLASRFSPSGFLTTDNTYGTRTLNNGFGNLYGLLGDNYTNNFDVNALSTALKNNGINVGNDLSDPMLMNYFQSTGNLSLNENNQGVLGTAFKDQKSYDLFNQEYLAKRQAGILNDDGSINTSLFGKGIDKNGNTTWGGGTGLQWLGFGAQMGMGLWGAYQQHKQLKLAQQAFEEQKALQRANFKMQAKSYNNSLRNQQSGRGYVGMSADAVRTLGQEYNNRKADETY